MSELLHDALVPAESAPSEVAAAPKPGAALRAERERQGLAIADVAQRLKYAPRQIESVEADDYAALPGLTFIRGFVRGYAKLLAVDAAPLVAALERNAGLDGGPTTVQLQSVNPVRAQFPASGTRHSSAWPWILGIVLVVAGVGGYSVYHWEAPSALTSPAPKSSEAPPVAPAAVPPGSVVGTIQSVPGVSTDPGTVPPPPAGAGQSGEPRPADGSAPPVAAAAGEGGGTTPSGAALQGATGAAAPAPQGRIRMVFRGESWTEIKEAGGRVVYSRKGAPGTEQWADGQPPFELVVGNAPETRVFYRGNEVDLTPYIKGTVARLQLQ